MLSILPKRSGKVAPTALYLPRKTVRAGFLRLDWPSSEMIGGDRRQGLLSLAPVRYVNRGPDSGPREGHEHGQGLDNSAVPELVIGDLFLQGLHAPPFGPCSLLASRERLHDEQDSSTSTRTILSAKREIPTHHTVGQAWMVSR